MIKDAERKNRPDSNQMLKEIKNKLAQEVKLKKLDISFAANAEKIKGQEITQHKPSFHRMGTNVPIEEMQDLRRSRVNKDDFRTSFSNEERPEEAKSKPSTRQVAKISKLD